MPYTIIVSIVENLNADIFNSTKVEYICNIKSIYKKHRLKIYIESSFGIYIQLSIQAKKLKVISSQQENLVNAI